MTGEEIGRRNKAKRIARLVVQKMHMTLRDLADDADWLALAEQAGVKVPSAATREMVLEIIGEIAI